MFNDLVQFKKHGSARAGWLGYTVVQSKSRLEQFGSALLQLGSVLTAWLHSDTAWLPLGTAWLRLDTAWLRLETAWLQLDAAWLRPDTSWCLHIAQLGSSTANSLVLSRLIHIQYMFVPESYGSFTQYVAAHRVAPTDIAKVHSVHQNA